MKLDGTDVIKPTPFDAHEQVVRQSHEHDKEEGYVPTEYDHQEYPKAVAHNEEKTEPVLAKDAEHEAELKGGK